MTTMGRNIKLRKLKINSKEISALLKLPSIKRYEYALKRIADIEGFWTIGEKDTTILIQKENDQSYFTIWPTIEYANIFIADNPIYHCLPVSLDEFEDEIATLITSKKYKFNVFPTPNERIGYIVSLNQFVRDLSHYLNEYR